MNNVIKNTLQICLSFLLPIAFLFLVSADFKSTVDASPPIIKCLVFAEIVELNESEFADFMIIETSSSAEECDITPGEVYRSVNLGAESISAFNKGDIIQANLEPASTMLPSGQVQFFFTWLDIKNNTTGESQPAYLSFQTEAEPIRVENIEQDDQDVNQNGSAPIVEGTPIPGRENSAQIIKYPVQAEIVELNESEFADFMIIETSSSAEEFDITSGEVYRSVNLGVESISAFNQGDIIQANLEPGSTMLPSGQAQSFFTWLDIENNTTGESPPAYFSFQTEEEPIRVENIEKKDRAVNQNASAPIVEGTPIPGRENNELRDIMILVVLVVVAIIVFGLFTLLIVKMTRRNKNPF